MDYSLLRANRTTHLKIVAVSLVAATLVVIVGLTARTTDINTGRVQTSDPILRAGQPATFAGQELSTVR
jgi:hypothetical protein